MMLLEQIIIFNLVLQNICGETIFPHFISDFFEDKHGTISFNHCWSYEDIKILSHKLYFGNNPKFLLLNTDFTYTKQFKNITNIDFIVVDIGCENSETILEKANKMYAFRFPYKWLLINSKQFYGNSSENSLYVDSYKKILFPFEILVDSEVFCAENIDKSITIWQYYKVNENFTIDREIYGQWRQETGLEIQRKQNVTSFRRKNLKRSNIRIVCVIEHNNTYNHLDDFRYQNEDLVTKTQYGVDTALMDYMNSTMVIVEADQWGVRSEDTGQWGGMAGFIQRKEADISGTPMFFFRERVDIGNFLKLTNPSRIAFLFRKPPLSYDHNIYALPFSWTVWMSSLGIVILSTVLLLISSHYENPRNPEMEKVRFGNIILLMAAAVCQQGCDVVPTGVPGRTLTLLIFTALMFLYVSYSANIVALLQSTSDIIKTMEDLLHSRLKVGCNNISYNYQYFMNSTRPIPQAIYQQKIGPHGYFNLQDGIEKVRKGLFAFHVDEGSAYYYIMKTFHEHEKCDVNIITGAFEEEFGWMAAAKDTPFSEMFRVGLLRLGENGIEVRYLRRFYPKPQCSHIAASFTSVGIVDFYPAVLVFLYGISVAVFIFLIEHMHKKFVTRKIKFNLRK